jgi:hypothetical protein
MPARVKHNATTPRCAMALMLRIAREDDGPGIGESLTPLWERGGTRGAAFLEG